MVKETELNTTVQSGLWGAIQGSLRVVDQTPAIAPAKRTGTVPLSHAQQQLWLLQNADPSDICYNLPFSWRLSGNVNEIALAKSLTALVERHEILRTTFVLRGDAPEQIISPVSTVPLVRLEVKGESVKKQEVQLQRMLKEWASQVFDLGQGPLLRAYLFRLSEQEHVFLFVIHHIIMDGASIGVIYRELGEFYRACCSNSTPALAPLPIHYADFALWQHQWLTDDLLLDQFDYWKKKLSGDLPVLELPSDHTRPSVRSSRGAIHFFRLSSDLVRAISSYRKKEKTTLFNLLLTAYKVLLLRYTGQTDIIIGSPMANRNRCELQPLIGFFPHTIVLRTILSPAMNFRQCLEEVQQVSREAYANQDVSFDRLLGELRPKRDLSHSPLFQTMFSFQRMPRHDLKLDGLALQPIDVDLGTSKYDFTFDAKETPQGISAYIEYNTDLFCRATIERLSAHFQSLLLSALECPEVPVGRLPMLSTAERQRILLEWNKRESAFPVEDCVTGLFEAQVERTPDEIAVVDGDLRLTFSELNAQANQLAHFLRSYGAGPEVLVGICLERSANITLALLACLKAGGAYVPLDPMYPAERLGFMLEDCRAPLLVTEKRFADKLLISGQKLILLDVDVSRIICESRENLLPTAHPENLVYVIYTSGSTGRPKGAGVYRRGFSNLLDWYLSEFSFCEQDRVLLMGSPSFDMMQKNFFAPLASGGQLHLLEPGLFDPSLVLSYIEKNRITLVNCTPSAFYAVLELAGSTSFERLQSLRYVILGGEPIAKAHVRPWLESPHCHAEIGNTYGPTECADIATIYHVTRSNLDYYETIPLGGPINNVKVAIVDPQHELCPIGVPGELCIGGVGVGIGYINDSAKTADRFVKNPFPEIPSPRIYKTGDLARYLSDGTLDYLGRMDHQIKIRGFRVELGEIETVFRNHPNVREVAVVAQEPQPGEKRIVAFFEAKTEPAPETAELRDFIRATLPDYMVPSAFIAMDALPVTPNGKINRKQLLESGAALPKAAHKVVAPRTDIENLLIDVWKEVLHQSQISVHDNFFELGGHSLLATQVVSRLRTLLKREISIRSFFQHPTVAELSALLDTEAHSCQTSIARISRDGELPLSSAQQRLWFLDQLEPEGATYVIRIGLRLLGSLDRAALQRSLNEIVRRHEALRTVFTNQEGKPAQRILAPYPVELPLVDLSLLPVPQREAEENRIEVFEASQHIDIQAGPIIRFKLLRLEEQRHVLLINTHHIAFDGWSSSVIYNELSELYEAFLKNAPSPLPDLPIQYADFGAWQHEWFSEPAVIKQLEHWQQQLKNPPPLSSFPTDHPRPQRQSYRGACLPVRLKGPLIESLKTFCQHEGCSLFMGLLAGFGAVLHRYTGQEDLLLGSPIANRNRTEIEPLIGCFLNTLVLRTDFSGEPTFRQLLGRVREVTLGAYANQDLPFERLIEEVKPVRDQSYSPLFQVLFILQNTPAFSAAAGEVNIEAFDVENYTTKFDLTLSLNETVDGLTGTAEYANDIFDPSTIQRILGCWEQLLLGVTANPDLQVSRVPMLNETEKQQVVIGWNQTQQEIGAAQGVSELIESQVASTPSAVALIVGQTTLTYAELNAKVNRLANHLRQIGVGPDVLVGICLERSIDMVVAMLGVLKAGGAYVPIDSIYPKDRRSYILKDANAPILITQAKIVDAWPELLENPLKLLRMDADREVLDHCSTENPTRINKPTDLAYVLFTSGSTGRPKGVAIEHRSVLRLAEWAKAVYSSEEMSGVLFATSICFDLSIFELLVPLTCGGKVILAENALQLPDLPAASQVTLINTVPSAIAALLQNNGVPKSVQTINLAGEPLSTALVNQLYALPFIRRVYDLYGPTEDTTYSTFALRRAGEPATIGRPLANEQVYILDKHLQPTPIGVPGELHIGGAGLARGYLNHPELTREKFIRNPFGGADGARLYKTGDLARFRADGNIEFLGRLDYQVKIRGFRIELGEIEAVLRRHPNVKEVVVVAQKEAGDQRLVAYLAPNTPPAPHANELRDFIRKSLPDYMVPSIFVNLEALPLTSNGKIDRKALPAATVDRTATEKSFVAPATPVELELASIWKEVLRAEKIGVEDNFFELGGHSLLATQVISRMHLLGYSNVTLTDLFSTPTIAALAKRAVDLKKAGKELPKIVALARKRR